jgi:hypothetical protein
MEYLKCPWCGCSHNRHENKCANCGGVLEHKPDIYKAIIKNHRTGVEELTSVVKRIARYLAILGFIIATTSCYFIYRKVTEPKSLKIISSTVPEHYQPQSKPTGIATGSSYDLTQVQIEKKPQNLPAQNPCKLNLAINSKSNQFGVSGHEVKESEVIINKPGENIILVLMAYDPVLWKIKKTFSTLVNGVVLAGYHEQMIYGLPKLTPVLRAIYETKSECPYFYDSLKSGGQKQYIEQRIQDITGSLPGEIINSPLNGKFYVGNVDSNSKLLEYSDEGIDLFIENKTKERGVTLDQVAPNEEGIRQLLREGKIRPAGTNDIENWAKVAALHNNNPRHGMIIGRTYVILSNIQFPRGMYGAHSRSFILNNNVSPPTGNIAHNTVYWLENGVCEGVACGL